MNREEIILKHLSLWRTTTFTWSQADCFLSVFNYVNEFRHRGPHDIAEDWRGTYHDEASAMRVLEREGGGLMGMRKAMLRAGFNYAITPVRGDVVCVRAGEHEIGGIYLGDMTALRLADRGQMDIRIKHIGAWHIP